MKRTSSDSSGLSSAKKMVRQSTKIFKSVWAEQDEQDTERGGELKQWRESCTFRSITWYREMHLNKTHQMLPWTLDPLVTWYLPDLINNTAKSNKAMRVSSTSYLPELIFYWKLNRNCRFYWGSQNWEINFKVHLMEGFKGEKSTTSFSFSFFSCDSFFLSFSNCFHSYSPSSHSSSLFFSSSNQTLHSTVMQNNHGPTTVVVVHISTRG